jgi:hypothetical protein
MNDNIDRVKQPTQDMIKVKQGTTSANITRKNKIAILKAVRTANEAKGELGELKNKKEGDVEWGPEEDTKNGEFDDEAGFESVSSLSPRVSWTRLSPRRCDKELLFILPCTTIDGAFRASLVWVSFSSSLDSLYNSVPP